MADKTEKEYRTLIAELNRVITDRAHAATGDRITLRDAVCAYVAFEQARGATLESVVRAIEAILGKAKEAAAAGSVWTDRPEDGLAQQLVDWCVEFLGNGEVLV